MQTPFGRKAKGKDVEKYASIGAYWLHKVVCCEGLAEKKSRIYSVLLTDTQLAKLMETVSLSHAQGVEQSEKIVSKSGGIEP